MKLNARLRLFLLGSSLLAAPLANATIYYWDTNAATAGFGTGTGGTWNSGNTPLWSTSSAGTATTPNVITNSLDDINFGTASIAYSGTVTLSGNTTARSATFSGSSNVILKGNGTARTINLGSGGLTMNDTSTVTLGDGVAGNNVLINLGATGQTWTNNSSNNLSILNTAATFSRSAGGTITFNQTGAGLFSMSTTVLGNDATGIAGPWAFFGTGTNTRYAYNNVGTIAGYSAGTAALDADALASSTTNYDFSTTGTTTLTASRTANTLRYSGTGNVIDLGADGSNTLTANGILAVGSSGTLTIQRTGGTGTLVAGSTGTNSELVIAGPQDINITAPISNGIGASTVTYSGTGTLTLAGNNTYSGGTRVNSGALTVNSATALGATGASLGVNGTLDFNGFSYNVGALNGDRGSALVTNTALGDAVDFTVGTGNASGSYAGAIAGNLRLIKAGSGTLSIYGNNTYTGGTTLNGGTINTVNANTFGSGKITVGGNATTTLTPTYAANPTLANALEVESGSTLSLSLPSNIYYFMTFSGVLSGSGTISVGTQSGATFSNTANTFTGTYVSTGSGVTVNSLTDSAGRIRFGSAGSTGGTFVLSSNLPDAVVLNSRQIELNTTTGTSVFENNATNATITVNTNLLISATGAKTFTLGGTNTGNNTFAGLINNGAGSVISLNKTGAGTWIVSGNNGFTGSVTSTANNGRLVLTGANEFTGQVSVNGTSGTGTIAFTSIADFGTASALGKGTAGVSILLGTGDTSPGRLEYIGSGDSISNRTVQLGSTTVGQQASGEIVNNGTGTLTFTGNNLAGNIFNTTISGITVTRALTLNGTNTGNNAISGIIQNNATATNGLVAVTKLGIGTWVLSGSNTYTGTTTLAGGGTLALDYGNNNNNKMGGALSLGGGTLNLRGATGNHTEDVTSTTLGAGHTRITRTGANTALLNLNAITRQNGGTISFQDDTVARTDTNNFNGILGGWATIGNNWAVSVVSGAADTPITALSSYSGDLVSSGAGSNTANYTLSGGQTQSSSVAANTIKITGTGNGDTLALGTNALTITSTSATQVGGILYVGGGDNIYNITGSSTAGIDASAANDLIINTVTGTLNISARINGSNGARNLVKSGAGTLIVSSANAYTGVTRVNEGILRLASATAAGTATNTLNAGIVVQNEATLELSGGISIGTEALTLTGHGVSNGGALRNVSGNNSYAGAITLANNSVGSGAITNAVARINADNGTALTLTGGITTPTTSGAGTNPLPSGGASSVFFGGAGDITVSTVAISGQGQVVKDGAGRLNLNAASTYTGGTTLAGGVLSFVTNGMGTSGSITFSGNSTLEWGTSTTTDLSTRIVMSNGVTSTFHTGGNNVIFASSIGNSSTGALVKSGAGRLTLSGNNTYTGTTTVSAGTLAVNGTLANTTTTVQNNATLQGSGTIGGSVTVQDGGTLATGNSIESLATGTLILDGGSTFAYETDNDADADVAGDLTAITGNLTLNLSNLALLTLTDLGSGAWAEGEKLTLISYTGSWNGGLFNYNGSTLADGATFSFSGIDWWNAPQELVHEL